MCFLELMFFMFGVWLQLRGKLRLGSCVIGRPYAAIAGAFLILPLPLSLVLWPFCWGATTAYDVRQAMKANDGEIAVSGQRTGELIVFFLEAGMLGFAFLAAGGVAFLGVLHSGASEGKEATTSAVVPLFYDGAVSAEIPLSARSYLLGAALGKQQWKPIAAELAQILHALNEIKPCVNWNICLLDAATAVRMNLNAMELRAKGNGSFPVVWMNLIYDADILRAADFAQLEQRFDLRRTGK
jgi:hypothetical protein